MTEADRFRKALEAYVHWLQTDAMLGTPASERELVNAATQRLFAELKKRKLQFGVKPARGERRVMRVRFVESIPGGGAGDIYFLKTAHGAFRRIRPPGDGHVLGWEELRAWFRKLGVTHVEQEYGNENGDDEHLKDGIYTALAWLRWCRRMDEEWNA